MRVTRCWTVGLLSVPERDPPLPPLAPFLLLQHHTLPQPLFRKPSVPSFASTRLSPILPSHHYYLPQQTRPRRPCSRRIIPAHIRRDYAHHLAHSHCRHPTAASVAFGASQRTKQRQISVCPRPTAHRTFDTHTNSQTRAPETSQRDCAVALHRPWRPHALRYQSTFRSPPSSLTSTPTCPKPQKPSTMRHS